MRSTGAKLLILLTAIGLLLGAASCVDRTRAARKPAVPQSISQGQGREPRLKVFIKETGEIKEMGLEEYVTNVVAGEMKNFFPENALAAQAILARTFVLQFVTTKKRSSLNPDAHISTDFEEAQAWNPQNVNARVRRAVKRTRGEVATFNGNYINAWFFSHAGGITATAKEGLNFKEAEPPYIKVVKSPDAPEAPDEFANWRAEFTKQEVAAALAKLGQQPGSIDSIKVLDRGPSGRATRMQIGNAVVMAPDFRVALDSVKMKSTLLTSARVEGDRVILAGKGFGHGVGMSQWGAFTSAKRNRSPEDIIRYYFRDVDVVKLY